MYIGFTFGPWYVEGEQLEVVNDFMFMDSALSVEVIIENKSKDVCFCFF